MIGLFLYQEIIQRWFLSISSDLDTTFGCIEVFLINAIYLLKWIQATFFQTDYKKMTQNPFQTAASVSYIF